jgi:hypothetical protein
MAKGKRTGITLNIFYCSKIQKDKTQVNLLAIVMPVCLLLAIVMPVFLLLAIVMPVCLL